MTAPVRSAVTPYRSQLPPARAGFLRLLHAELTKLRTVSRWLLTLLAGVLITIAVSLLSAAGNSVQTANAGGGSQPAEALPVVDAFQFVHQPLRGDGSITARVTDLTVHGDADIPWAKAGILVKESTEPGTPYAAMMLTPDHGVRLQSDFTGDIAGSDAGGGTPVWLRLTREGDTLTGYESADGDSWRRTGTVRLDGLPRTAEAGLFVASPEADEVRREFGSTSVNGGPSSSTAVFDSVTLSGGDAGGWRNETVGDPNTGPGRAPDTGDAQPGATGDPEGADGTFTVTGSGDIAPHALETDIGQMSLSGVQIGLIAFAALGVLFITAEYRRGMIRTTFAAEPRRGRVLLAKAAVLGVCTFAAGLVAAGVSFLAGQQALRSGGYEPPVFPELSLTDGPSLRAVVGTAVLLALVAVFALALGALLRHTAAAVTIVVVLFVLPLIIGSGLPLGAAEWLHRLAPIAGFAVQRTIPRYEQVETVCLPEDGCTPLAPWAGLGVLALWAAVTLGLAVWRLRRRDA